MYAIRVTGPSGHPQYVNVAPVPFLSGYLRDAMLFDSIDEARLWASDEIPLVIKHGRIIDVIDFDEDIA